MFALFQHIKPSILVVVAQKSFSWTRELLYCRHDFGRHLLESCATKLSIEWRIPAWRYLIQYLLGNAL